MLLLSATLNCHRVCRDVCDCSNGFRPRRARRHVFVQTERIENDDANGNRIIFRKS